MWRNTKKLVFLIFWVKSLNLKLLTDIMTISTKRPLSCTKEIIQDKIY